jgi:hypothetical protein
MRLKIEDRLEIQDLLYRYARCADERDVDGFASCFHQGRATIVGPGFQFDTAAAVIDSLRASFSWTMHKVHNHEFAVEGDRATGYTYCVASHVRPGPPRIKLDWHIRYADELIRDADGWRFLKRTLHPGLIENVPLPD